MSSIHTERKTDGKAGLTLGTTPVRKTVRSAAVLAAMLLLCLVLPQSCDHSLEPAGMQRPESAGTISFRSEDFEEVNVSTRSTLSETAERRIVNGEVLIFNNDGNLVYSCFLDNSNRAASIETLQTMKRGWFVNTTDDSPHTLKLAAADITNGHIYIVANLFNDTFNISRQMIQTVNHEDDLRELVCRFQDPSTARLSGMLYLGYTSATISGGSVTLNPTGTAPGTLKDGVIICERVDAKVRFNVGIVPGAVTSVQEQNSQGQTVTVYRRVTGFTPQTYQVMNLPKGCWLKERADDAQDELTGGYFNGKALPFEERTQNVPCGGFAPTDLSNSNYLSSGFTRSIDSFSFYMLENRKPAKASVNSAEAAQKYGFSGYHLRDKRVKDSDGSFSEDQMWEYAPETATYVILKGTLDVEVTASDNSPRKMMAVDATYCVHLGDFGSSTAGGGSGFDDYRIRRHTFYTYNINISGFDRIETEVNLDQNGWQDSNEKQSGAEGVVLYHNQYHEFDSHFGQRVFSLNIDELLQIGANNITWAVTTPFGREGTPDKVGLHEEEVANGLDYQWVHFLVNTKNSTYIEPHGGPGNSQRIVSNPQYPNGCRLNRMWPEGGKNNRELMDVMQLSTYIREQMERYVQNRSTDFDSEGNLYLTAFVDEFYYTQNPVTLEKDPDLWHRFVNKPPRTMVIVCDSKTSADGNSMIFDGAITIRQRSIQTIYNDKLAHDAWGNEFEDEYRDRFFFFSSEENRSNAASRDSSVGATSDYNGLFNSVRHWGLVSGNSFKTLYWSDFFDYSRENDYTENGIRYGFLKTDPDIANLRFGALSRNRDENGNGIIDEDEVKWYIGALGQLQDIYVGGLGISKAAQLYNLANPTNGNSGYPGNSYHLWRSHVISSTSKSSKVQFIWAEEGCSFSPYGKDSDWNKPGAYSVRCIRNLPSNAERVYDITDPDDFPVSPVVVTKLSNDQVEVDLTLMNDESKRPKTTTELAPMDENSVTARPSNRFRTQEYVWLNNEDNVRIACGNPTGTFKNTDDVYDQLYKDLILGKSWSSTGSRVPNVREMIILTMNLPYVSENYAFWHNNKSNYHLVVNNYSFGNTAYGGKNWDNGNGKKSSWLIAPENATVEYRNNLSLLGIRFVKDID